MHISYKDTHDIILKKRDEFSAKIQYVKEHIIQADASQLQNELSIYRYITETTVYDYEGIQTGIPTDTYDLLVHGKAICYNYLFSMKYLLNLAVIEAHNIRSDGHVKIDEEYYRLDATGMPPAYLTMFNFTDHYLTETFETPRDDIHLGNQNYRKLYIMNLDGTQSQKVSDIIPNILMLHDRWLYYADTQNGYHLYKIRLDGSEVTELDNSIEVDKMHIDGNILNYGSAKNGQMKQLDL